MSGDAPEGLRYTRNHEWARIEGDVATVGITDFAQAALGDIVFSELPGAGTALARGEPFGVVESVKSVSDLYAPLSGEVLESNGALEGDPGLVNNKPYEAWMVKVRIADPSEADGLLDAAGYRKHCEDS